MANKFCWALWCVLSTFCSLPTNKLSLVGCTLCSSGCCTFYLLPKTYICLSRQVIQWPPYGWCRGQSVIIYYNKRHGVRWCTVYLSICQRLQYFIIRRVFVCPDIWQALPAPRGSSSSDLFSQMADSRRRARSKAWVR